MYDYGTFFDLMETHLEENVTIEGEDIYITRIFPDGFIEYPLKNITLALMWDKMTFTPAEGGNNHVGHIQFRLDVFSQRDYGMDLHMDVINLVIDALLNFSGYSLSEFSVNETRFDRTVSALKTSVTYTTDFIA